MTLGVPAGEGGSSDTPTVPLVAGSGPGESTRYRGGERTPPLGISRGTPRRPWLPRWLRRCLIAVLALALACALAFVTLLIVTPSVSNAPALARAYDQAHHAAYPGPAVPARFAASLVSTEDHRFHSEPGID